MNKKKVDLHIHTNDSDGTWNLAQLIDELDKNDIFIFSITDHDCINNSKLMMKENIGSNKIFIPGVEISATYDNIEYHINAYNFDFENTELVELLRLNQKIRKDFNKKIIRFFEKNYDLKLMYEYQKYKNDPYRGGWKSLNFLKDRKLVEDLDDFFIKISEIKERMNFLIPEKVIDIIHQAKGFAFLAHPASYFKGELLDKSFLQEWVKMGIDGIEVYSPYLEKLRDAEYYIDFCKKNNLMYSSGSDCHGDFIKERKLGKPEVFLKDINIDELLT